jgi:hypothetical protein
MTGVFEVLLRKPARGATKNMGPALSGRKLVEYSRSLCHYRLTRGKPDSKNALAQSLVNSVRFDKAGGGDQCATSTRQFLSLAFTSI